MEHLEFIDHEHFENDYHRKWAGPTLAPYIDFCWETNFDQLLKDHNSGFSDVLFPNIGYTYLINLGTPFVMQLEKTALQVKNDGFLPRHHYVTCHHSVGNKLFGIKFKVCPVVFEKDVDFSEYKDFIYPLAYLIDRKIVQDVKTAASFDERVKIVFDYYEKVIEKYAGSLNYVRVVTEILSENVQSNHLDQPVHELSEKYELSERTLQKYFKVTTSFSSKEAFQTIRIRRAALHLATSPKDFKISDYGYPDYSHFSKHLLQFTGDKYFPLFESIYLNSRL